MTVRVCVADSLLNLEATETRERVKPDLFLKSKQNLFKIHLMEENLNLRKVINSTLGETHLKPI